MAKEKSNHKTSKWWELFRFLVCGIVAALFDYLTCQLIVMACGNALGSFWTIALSTMAGFIVGVVTNYIISVLWVYQNVDKSINKKSKKFIALFVLFSFIGMLLSIGTMYLCELVCVSIWGQDASIINTQLISLIKQYGIGFLAQASFWRYFIAFCLKTIVGLVFNYFTRKYILFKEPKVKAD